MAQERAESVELVDAETVGYIAAAVQVAALTGILAWVSVDLGPVPFSFQPFAVFFAGLLLGPLWGGFAMLVYVFVGLAGAPIFANGGAGLGYVLGPTGGFLVGFVVAAVLVGAIAHRSLTPTSFSDLSTVAATVALVAALGPIYAIGVPWFATVQGWTLVRAGTFMSWFFVGDLIKVVLTVGIVAGGNGLLDRFR
ncbi:MAG: biotin transporter BioY [Halovenus sp.]